MAHQTPDFERLVLKTMEEWKIPGLSVAIVYDYATLAAKKCVANTLFDCGSTTKTTTAAAVALLVDDDDYPQMQWSTPVSQLLPDDFVLSNTQLTKDVTVEDILSHRTGIAAHDDSYLSVRARTPDSAKSMTRNLRNLPFAKPLRTAFIYSNIMYTVATHLVETVSGMPYAEFLRKKIWEPLGMTNTFHDLPDIEAHDAMERKATGYRWDKEKEKHVAIPAYSSPEGQGAGCIFSSAGDYAKWVRALIKHSPPLSEAAHIELITPRTIFPLTEEYDIPFGSPALYCLGLIRETYRGRTLISHDGDVPGFKAKLLYLPEFEWGLVILANLETSLYAEQILSHTLVDEVLSVPMEERVDWSAFFRKWYDRDKEHNEDDPEFTKPTNPEPLGVALETLTGTYRDAGYKDLVLEMKDGKLVADCHDRCFPFVLTLEHLTEGKFAIEVYDVWGGERRKLKGEIRIQDGRAVSLGVGFEGEIEGHLTWFDRIE
ncbi:beta-lactamase/transpeptidase-like protein [Ophiobolus disseminans]|uniref:Beta-lactamase/transpeptidase-like protein n=1 Tax=Ophiobolus disseminans TaxID=1469910 RepID=A0A6A7A473_9PLEO|nr:beta-lactamase/transpeptidase-like protein [Ophiobolus disseminans]